MAYIKTTQSTYVFTINGVKVAVDSKFIGINGGKFEVKDFLVSNEKLQASFKGMPVGSLKQYLPNGEVFGILHGTDTISLECFKDMPIGSVLHLIPKRTKALVELWGKKKENWVKLPYIDRKRRDKAAHEDFAVQFEKVAKHGRPKKRRAKIVNVRIRDSKHCFIRSFNIRTLEAVRILAAGPRMNIEFKGDRQKVVAVFDTRTLTKEQLLSVPVGCKAQTDLYTSDGQYFMSRNWERGQRTWLADDYTRSFS